MLEELKEQVLIANLELVKSGLVKFTFGNASGFDFESKLFVIKPSGVSYNQLTAKDMVVVDLDGNVVEGDKNPSSDTPTHAVLYRAFPGIGGVVHTHSHWATAWAQAVLNIPVLGTTHADYFNGEIPCTRDLEDDEIAIGYEKNTGLVIAETFEDLSPYEIPACLVAGHGPFCWGKDCHEAVFCAEVLEEIAALAYHSDGLDPELPQLSATLRQRHYYRKHGKNSYYGQR